MEKRQIGIIGAGNLGARHLQAMALLKEACRITVADVSAEALKKAEKIFRAAEGAQQHEVSFVTEIAAMPEQLDLVVVATAADVRRSVIEVLLRHADVSYLVLEKVLFQRLEDYDAVRGLLREKQVQAFVNCPRRMHPVYETIRKKLETARTIEFQMSASDWGLGGNAIHMLDLIAYLSGSENIVLDVSALEESCLSSKRKGFLELAGTMRGSMGRCRAFSFSSYLEMGVPDATVILSDTCRMHLQEWKQELLFADASSKWEWKQERFVFPYQSRLTQLVAEELFVTGSCRLTPFEESCRLHLALLRQLIPYFEKQGVKQGLCPIT